jgi:hypothetical protein
MALPAPARPLADGHPPPDAAKRPLRLWRPKRSRAASFLYPAGVRFFPNVLDRFVVFAQGYLGLFNMAAGSVASCLEVVTRPAAAKVNKTAGFALEHLIKCGLLGNGGLGLTAGMPTNNITTAVPKVQMPTPTPMPGLENVPKTLDVTPQSAAARVKLAVWSDVQAPSYSRFAPSPVSGRYAGIGGQLAYLLGATKDASGDARDGGGNTTMVGWGTGLEARQSGDHTPPYPDRLYARTPPLLAQSSGPTPETRPTRRPTVDHEGAGSVARRGGKALP